MNYLALTPRGADVGPMCADVSCDRRGFFRVCSGRPPQAEACGYKPKDFRSRRLQPAASRTDAYSKSLATLFPTRLLRPAPRKLAHCFTCSQNLTTIDLLLSLGCDLRSTVAMRERLLEQYQARLAKEKAQPPPAI